MQAASLVETEMIVKTVLIAGIIVFISAAVGILPLIIHPFASEVVTEHLAVFNVVQSLTLVVYLCFVFKVLQETDEGSNKLS